MLHLLGPRGVLRPALCGPRFALFGLGLPAGGLRLRAPPVQGFGGDPRRLGVAVTRLLLLHRAGEVAVELAELAERPGFHALEQGAWCWSDGDAALPVARFAGPAGAAALLLQGFGPGGAALGAEAGPAVFLAGDSYPQDRHVEDRLLAALHPLFAGRAVRQAGLFGPGEAVGPLPVAARLARLHRLLDTLPDAGEAVLIGRSSGARVATLCAAARRVRAVLCLGYPFRQPGRPVEPERFAHLATLATPTLILQGEADPYGAGRAVRERYALSAAIEVAEVATSHEWHLDAPGWAAVARRAMLFLAGTAPADVAAPAGRL